MPLTSNNPLEAAAKKVSTQVLLDLTRDTTVLYLHVKMAHWNLKDVNFIAIHELLDDIAASTLEIIDEIAERARQLGVPVDANLNDLSKSEVGTFPIGVVSSKVACAALAESFGRVVKGFHGGIDTVDEAGDAVTADILTQSSGTLEKGLWKIESHLTI